MLQSLCTRTSPWACVADYSNHPEDDVQDVAATPSFAYGDPNSLSNFILVGHRSGEGTARRVITVE